MSKTLTGMALQPLIKLYNEIHRTTVTSATHGDGQEWVSTANVHLPSLQYHAIKFSDGRVFDVINGFRNKYPSRGVLQHPSVKDYCERMDCILTHVIPINDTKWRSVLDRKMSTATTVVAYRFSNGYAWDQQNGWCDLDDLLTDEWMKILADLDLAEWNEPLKDPTARNPDCLILSGGVCAVRIYPCKWDDPMAYLPLWFARFIAAGLIRYNSRNMSVELNLPNFAKTLITEEHWLTNQNGQIRLRHKKEFEKIRDGSMVGSG